MIVFQFFRSSEGFSNPDDSNSEVIIRKWKPEEANQFEIGVKTKLFDGLLTSTISYYNITVDNRLREVIDYVYKQDGKFRSKGFEFDLITSPAKGWNLIAGYGYNDNKFVKSEYYSEGLRNASSPKHVANLWTSYKFLDNSIKGLGFGAGMNFVSESLLDYEDDFTIPAYKVFNATAFYDQPKYRIGLNFNNIGNIEYWDLYARAQKPFEVLVNLSFKF